MGSEMCIRDRISEDMAELLAKVNGLVEEYSAAYSSYINSIGEDRLGDHAYTTFPTDTLQVTDVLYEFMDLQQNWENLLACLVR